MPTSPVIVDSCSTPDLALIVGAARSGTTLLRVLLDANPDVACPAEVGLPGLLTHLARVWHGLNGSEHRPGEARTVDGSNGRAAGPRTVSEARPHPADGGSYDPGAATLPAECREWIREVIVPLMSKYCEPTGKRLYVDKSLDSVFALAPTLEAFPTLRCILIFRHVMDTIMSGLEASPWGFTHYGYNRYVRDSSENLVAALARYWLDHVTAALDWERKHPDTCCRIRYEDLVIQPEETVRRVEVFLGAAPHHTVLDDAFRRPLADGPADHKVWYTTAVHPRSVGHGKRVPVSMLPPPLLSAINEKLELLEYPHLDESWNATGRSIDLDHETLWARLLTELLQRAEFSPECPPGVAFILAAEDDSAVRWTIDTTTRTIKRGADDVESVLIGTIQDLVLLLAEEESPADLVRSGRVRYLRANREAGQSLDLDLPDLDTVLSVLRDGLVEMAAVDV